MLKEELLRKKRKFEYRKFKSTLMLSLSIAASIIAVLPLLYIFFYTTASGASALNFDFFTNLPKPFGEEGGGMGNAILGTFIMLMIGSTFGIPIGIMTGIYVSEYSGSVMSVIIKFLTDVLSGIPSIVIGIFTYGLIVLQTGKFSALAGGFALGLLMIPTITRTTEEMLKLVPNTLREASLALGITKWKTSLFIVLKTASSGIITGILLALARAAGETAPLLFTSFGNNFWSTSLNEPMSSIPVQIYNFAISPYEDWHKMAWAGAFVLITLVFVVNLIVRIITKRKFTLN
ncbi:MAG TPA: phosphate ABC transporter permease PstA [Ignavibacteria bacterium]|nr:phosphate ABC transporter permease PstA [Ignavibacteria bacterium]